MLITVNSEDFLLELDTEKVDGLKINGETTSIGEFDLIMQQLAFERNLEVKKMKISNKYLRSIIRRGDDIYHILEKPAGLYNMDCRAIDGGIKTVKLHLPNTVMVVRLTYTNGKYISRGERLFHTAEPVKEDLSNTVYEWGASNVYPNFNICWGSGKLPHVDNNTSHKLMDEFFGSIKNNDLLRNKKIDWARMDTTTEYRVELADVKKHTMTIKEIVNGKLF